MYFEYRSVVISSRRRHVWLVERAYSRPSVTAVPKPPFTAVQN